MINCRSLACAVILMAAVVQPVIACTQGESDNKSREVIMAMVDIRLRDPAKATVAERKFDRAMQQTLKPATTSADRQASTDAFCAALDEIMADLRR